MTVDLATGAAAGGHAEGDTLTGIESIWGSDHADSLTGDEGNNSLDGRGGDDTLTGGEGHDLIRGGSGADVLDGGGGQDRAAYELSDAGVTVDLATGAAAGGHAEGDTLTGIESIWGSDHADSLTGDEGNNSLDGRGGNDALTGGEGDDTLRGDEGDDSLDGGDGDDSLDGGFGDDTLRGGSGDDTFYFGDGDTIEDFGDGSDRIDISVFRDINFGNFEANVTIQAGSDGGTEVVIGDAVFTLTTLSPADITAEDFLFLV